MRYFKIEKQVALIFTIANQRYYAADVQSR
jgi:hypothetical protein